jgi:peptidoglycan hydrolase CwlO-like protein
MLMQRLAVISRGAVPLAIFAALALVPSAGRGDLTGRAQSLEQGIASDSGQIQAYQGRLDDLHARLAGLERSLSIQRILLVRVQRDLAGARKRLIELRAEFVVDRRRLAAQLVAQYESPPPDLVNVVLESHGFTDLMERVDQMRRLAAANTRVVKRVARDRQLVSRQVRSLALEQARQQQVTSAVLVERDQVARLQLSLLQRQHITAADRASKQAELHKVRKRLAVLQAQAAAAQRASFADVPSGGVGYTGGGFTSHGGDFGFFPAPGTNYSVGEEPQIAAHLDALGKALHLHLIGISGYRSPQHSVEVGGFADDPHTRGEASDTPGVEGVPEQTLLQFGLTRPFPGAAEADHIQLA